MYIFFNLFFLSVFHCFCIWFHFQFGLYADGIEALLGDDEGSVEEEGVEPTAGMSLTIMDVLLRPIEFFRGSSGLMSAVWNAPSEPVSALQVDSGHYRCPV